MGSSEKIKKPRVRKQPSYKSFKLSKKIKPAASKPLPGIYQLFKQIINLLLKNKKLFFGIVAIYILLNLLLVNGLSLFSDFFETKQEIDENLNGQVKGWSAALALFGVLLSSGSSSASDAGSIYQLFLSLIISLSLIWSIRQVMAGERIIIRQAFYQSMYPLVQFILIVCVITLQLLPFLAGNFLLSTVIAGSIAITFAEKSLFILLFFLLALLSFYMLLSSIFALYIVTLPNMTPMKALRSARGLVLNRRFSVGLRLLGLPILSFLFFIAIILPLIYFLPFMAVVLFLILSGLMLYFFHAYMYSLYRALL